MVDGRRRHRNLGGLDLVAGMKQRIVLWLLRHEPAVTFAVLLAAVLGVWYA